MGIAWLDPTTIIQAAGPSALLAVCAIVFAESGLLVGFFLPGDSLVFLAGVFSGAAGAGALARTPWAVVAAAIAAAAFVGDQTGYRLGARFVGLPAVQRRMSDANRRRLGRAQRAFDRFGGPIVMLARFVPVLRTFVPFATGMARYPLRRFVPFNLAGGVGWAFAMVLAGRLLAGVPFVANNLTLITLGIVALSVAPLAVRVLVDLRTRAAPARTPSGR